MSDWTTYLGRSRRMMEDLAWFVAAIVATLLIASTAALAMWFQRDDGIGNQEVIIIDMSALEATAVGEDPGPAPQASDAAPDAPDAPDLNDEPPTPETALDDVPEFDQPDLPEMQEVAEQLPDTTPPPPLPEPEPVVQKADVEKPKPVERKKVTEQKKAKKADKVQEEKGKKSQAQIAQKAGGASAAGNAATASEIKKWDSRIRAIIVRRVGNNGYGTKGNVELFFEISASGAITAISTRGSTGDPNVDARILARAKSAKFPPPPDGLAKARNVLFTIE